MNNEAQLHRMARKHHATMKKLDSLREKFSGFTQRAVGTLEVGTGAWLGGLIDGKGVNLPGAALPVTNMSLWFGGGFILLDLLSSEYAQDQGHARNLGTGFLASYLARSGHTFGQTWGAA